jgi:tripartite-type tricarboxylate transporter receptor subunit TctC
MGIWARLALFVLASLASVVPAHADDFYKGKTLTVIVGFSAGGGFDINARLLARHIGRYIPGTPDVIVENLPGAGSITAVVRLDSDLAKDGTVIDTFNFGRIGDSLLQPDQTKIDFRNYAWIGSISEDLTTCYLWRDKGPKTLAEMKAGGHYYFGLAGVGTSEDLNTKILKNIFGINIDQVAGYPGSAEIRVAIERGELDGDCGAWSSIPEDWTKSAKFHPVSRSGRTGPPGMPASVPYTVDAAPSDAARNIVRLLLADSEVGRPFIASRAVPAERIAILRTAFDAAVKDKDFLAEAEKLRLPVQPRTGEEAAKVVAELYAAPQDVVAAARKVIAQ